MKKLNKKGQVVLSFNYITAVVIMGVILLFGAISVTKLMKDVDSVQSQKFKSDFEKNIAEASTSIYSVQKIELSGLKDFKKVCFVDFEKKSDVLEGELGSNYATIKEYLNYNISNIFLIDGDVKENFLNRKLQIDDPYYLCLDVSKSGTINLILTGLGKKVKLEEYTKTQ